MCVTEFTVQKLNFPSKAVLMGAERQVLCAVS